MRNVSKTLVLGIVVGFGLSSFHGAFAARENIALNKTVAVSSTENGLSPSGLVDGDKSNDKRWGSNWTLFTPQTNPLNDSAWVYVDLGKRYNVDSVCIWWEHSSALQYKIQIWDSLTALPVPKDAGWTDVLSITWPGFQAPNLSPAEKKESKFTTPKDTRYVRVRCIQRQTQYGYGICELEIFGNEIVAVRPTAFASVGAAPYLLSISHTDTGVLFNYQGVDARNLTAAIYSISGQMIAQLTPVATGELFWNSSHAVPGSYIVRIKANGVMTERAFTLTH
jgi:hypothetical protein